MYDDLTGFNPKTTIPRGSEKKRRPIYKTSWLRLATNWLPKIISKLKETPYVIENVIHI